MMKMLRKSRRHGATNGVTEANLKGDTDYHAWKKIAWLGLCVVMKGILRKQMYLEKNVQKLARNPFQVDVDFFNTEV